jgi:hypothetical protein
VVWCSPRHSHTQQSGKSSSTHGEADTVVSELSDPNALVLQEPSDHDTRSGLHQTVTNSWPIQTMFCDTPARRKKPNYDDQNCKKTRNTTHLYDGIKRKEDR